MRADAKGLWWEDIDHKTVKKFEVLKRNEWVEVIPGYWIEESILNNPEIDYLEHIFPLHRAYDEVRNKSEKCVPPEPTWLNDDYLPNYAEAANFSYNLFTDEELISASMQYMLTGKKYELEYDIECYANYFLIAFYCDKTKKVAYFEKQYNDKMEYGKLAWIVDKFKIVGFNSNNYDAIIAALAIAGKSTQEMKAATTKIIEYQERGYNVLRQYKVKALKFDHVDIIEVAPLFASLKIYGGRMHSKRMQDLPFHHAKELNPKQIIITRWYCINDLTTTSELKNYLNEEFSLRDEMSAEYGVDLRSKSDAQIAEAVIGHELEVETGLKYYPPTILPGTSYKYQPPAFISFQTPLMQSVFEIVKNANFVVGEFGNIALPQELKDLKIKICEAIYTMGIGGLHSNEKCAAHHSGKATILVDRDVISYYPFIIWLLGLYPKHIGPIFLRIYKRIIDRRLAAKEAENKKVSNSLKIVINGSFGKFGSMYSLLYAPDLLIQTTITGQLALLMKIEALELCGIPVVSANTDGIVIKCPREKEHIMDSIVAWWENVTGFKTEATYYKSLISQNVNNYIGVIEPALVKPGKERLKVKGAFARPGLSKNPTNEICIMAIEALLCDGVPIETTIRNCKDITKFLNVRTVKGGAVKVWSTPTKPNPNTSDAAKEKYLADAGWYRYYGENSWRHKDMQGELAGATGTLNEMWLMVATKQNYSACEYLGKAIRWYYSSSVGGTIIYAESGKKVPKSDGAKPLMLLPDTMPTDVNYDWYIAETEKMLRLGGL
jgi:hypothetical protein